MTQAELSYNLVTDSFASVVKYTDLFVNFLKHFTKFFKFQTEWRNLGVQQSVGWVHYMIHVPEPHIIMFRRLKESANSS